MNEQTLQKLKQMKLLGMARAFATSIETGTMNQFTTDEMIAHMTISEWDERNNRKIERQVRNAKFRYKAHIEQLYFDIDRTLDKNQMMRLADCNFIRRHENVLITGSTGIGKSYIASAIGNQACIFGFKVLYANSARLFARLKQAKSEGTYIKELGKIEKQDLLILDDFGLQPLDNHGRSALMEIIEDRHGNRSTIITSQIPVSKWYDIIGDSTLADAILDRLVHEAHRMELIGDTLRRKQKNIY